MAGRMLRMTMVVAICWCGGAVARERPHHARIPSADRDRYADPASPYKASRLSSSRGEPPLNVPGQTTVLTRQVLDDMNATSLRDALGSTAGVTVGR
jgi:outer membrane receptor for monomeric catechols